MNRLLRFFLVLCLLVTCGGTSLLWAANAPEKRTGRQKTDNYIQVASMLVREAQQMRKVTPSSKTIKSALDLYISAGKLFELAAQEYKMLMMQKLATQMEVDRALNGVKYCLENARQMRGAVPG